MQKREVRSCGAPFRGVQRRAWRWRWGAGWLDRPVGSPPMGAWTATAQRESKSKGSCEVSRGFKLPCSPRQLIGYSAAVAGLTLSLICYSSFSLIFPGVRLSSDAQFSDFLDGLGPAQLVGRQTLATPPMGEKELFTLLYSKERNYWFFFDFFFTIPRFLWFSGDIQIGMVEKKGALEVEIIRARGLVGKPGSKALPGNAHSQMN